MKIRLRTVLVGATVAAVAVAAGIVVGGGAAYAGPTPGWEPDVDARGYLTFYDASGNVITGGSTTAGPFVAYAAASAPSVRPSDNKATLFAYTPKLGQLPSAWSGDFLTASTNYPRVGAPANIAALTVPVASGQAGDQSLASYAAFNPNTETAADWAGRYEIRLVTSGPLGADSRYFRTDILVTGTTWSVDYPVPVVQTPTSTTIQATPPSPAPQGTSVALTANVTPAGTAGSVHFFDGATDLGAASYTPGTGVATMSVSPANGSHSYTATFTPADPVAFGNSTSAALPYTVGTPTVTTLSAAPPSGTAAGPTGTLGVTLTSHTTPLNTAGSVHFFDGATDLGAGTYTPATGDATLAVTLTTGNHALIATFTPSGAGLLPSSSSILNYAVVGANSSAIPIDAQNNTAPYAGSLVLQVATGTAVHLTQVDPATAAGHPALATDPTGHRHAAGVHRRPDRRVRARHPSGHQPLRARHRLDAQRAGEQLRQRHHHLPGELPGLGTSSGRRGQ